MTAAVGLIGFLRKKFLLGVLAVAVIVGGQVITQSLKRFILWRPELVQVTGDFTGNSFPSGHTTIAMTVFIATFLVVPYRWRGVAMFFVITWAIAIGSYTLTAKWHRLSDTIGATFVALIMGSLVSLILLKSGRIVKLEGAAKIPRVLFVVMLALFSVLMLAIGVFIVGFSFTQSFRDPVIEWNIYLAATSLSTGFATFAALVFWGSWKRLEVV